MRRILTRLASVLILLGAATGQGGETPRAGGVRGAVLPSAEELAFTAIGWRASFWEAVVEAHKADRPILLWAMNGHPLACT
ncbi:MAG: hypothetical protein ACT4PV_14470 [Planctomycetaceae bacterium]